MGTVVLSILKIAKSSMGLMPQLTPIKEIVQVADRLTGMTLLLPFGWIGDFFRDGRMGHHLCGAAG
jgi:hypothetical protein